MKTKTKRQRYVKSLVITLLMAVIILCMGIAAYATDTAASVLSEVALEPPTVSADGKSIILPEVPDGYVISINGTSNESVIDKDGNIYTPLVDTTVKVNYKITKTADATTAVDQYNEAAVVISGKYKTEAQDNAEPAVLPKLQEWKGGIGTVKMTSSTRVVVTHESFRDEAEIIRDYIADVLGCAIEIVTGDAFKGDIVIGYTDAKELGKEGYTVELSDRVTILAYSDVGALYGGSTVTQMLTLSEGFELPQGLIRDYPAYEVRASMLDVSGHYIPIDYLTDMGKYLAYFKVNQIHMHINENAGQNAKGFRVESKRYPEINANVGANVYTQEEYREFQTELLKYGIKVITEIDSPAHAGFAGLYDSSLVRTNASGVLDLTNNYDGCVAFMKGLIDEFVNGYDGNPPVIIDEIDTIHLGMDEYTYDHAKYKEYMKEICDYANSLGKRVHVWSSLKTEDFAEELPISPENVTVNYWGDADLSKYAEEGFPAITNYSSKLYVLPGTTSSFGDWRDVATLYESYEANHVSSSITLAESSPLLLGVEGAVWHHWNSGASKEGMFARVRDQMLFVSEKAWHGKAEGVTGEEFEERLRALQDIVPVLDPQSFVPSNEDGVIADYDFENTENGTVKDNAQGLDATLEGLSVDGTKLTLNGEGYLSLPVKQIGFPYTVSFGLTYSSTTSGVLFAGGDTTFWLNKDGDGKLTFTRELYSYAFDFKFATNSHYNIMLLCDKENLSLYVDGIYVEDAHVTSMETFNQKFENVYFSESVLSCARIGEGIVGSMDNLKILGTADKDALLGLADIGYRNLALGKNTTASGTEVKDKWLPENAVDGITEVDNLKVSLNRADDAWLTIDLGDVYSIDEITIDFRKSPKAYKFLVSQDGVNFTEVYDQPAASNGSRMTDVIKLDKAVGARYVKYQQVKMFSTTLSSGTTANYSGSFFEIQVFGSDIAIDKNLALGKEVIECTYNEKGTTGVPQDMTDGNLDNKACFEGDSAYFTIDLEKECFINGVNIYWGKRPNEYQIFVSSDRKEWKLVYEDLTDNGGVAVTDKVSLTKDVIGRYVKVVQTEKFQSGNKRYYWGSVKEIEIIGTEADVDKIDEIDSYLKTLSGDAKTHLYNRVALVKRIMSQGNGKISAIAIKLLYEEYERMLSSSYTVDTSKGSIYNALLDMKTRNHARNDDAYNEYEKAYKLVLSAYINSDTSAADRTSRLSLLTKATLAIARPDTIETTFDFSNANKLIDGYTGTYYSPATAGQAKGKTITVTYNDPITFTSIRLAMKSDSSAIAKSQIEYSTDGTTFKALKETNKAGTVQNLVFGNARKTMCEIILTEPIENVVAIRITVTKTETKKNLSISEIIVNEHADLDVIIPEVSDYSLERYTAVSRFPLNQYFNSDAVSRRYIDQLKTYILYLVPIGDVEAVSAKIAELKALDTTLYTDASVAALNAAIAEAESFVSSFNDSVSIYDSDRIIAALTDAKNSLVRKSSVDTSALESAIASANVNSWEYTYYSYKFLSDAVEYAKSLLNNTNATQAIIDEACARINYAVSALVTRGTRVNVALNKDVVVSGREVANDLGPELAVDGNLTTVFSPNKDKDGAYFIIDLGEIMMIDTVEAVWKKNPPKFNIQVSTDGKNYVTVAELYDYVTSGVAVTNTVNFGGSVEARYVKVDFMARYLLTPDQHQLQGGAPYEFLVYPADMTPATSELQYLVSLYENGITQNFAPECKAKIEAALAEAKAILESGSATAEQIESLTKSLTHTTDALSFTQADDSVHTHTCPCGVILSEAHNFDEGKVVLAPTVFETGEKLYTCSVCGGTKTEAVSTIDLYLYSMKLNVAESVNVVFVAEVKEGLTDPYLVVELLGKEYKLTKYTVRADGRYEFVFRGVTPANMTDVMKATLFANNGEETVCSEYRSFTIRDYCSAILKAYSAEVKLRNLISDILVYGAALQTYVGHKTDDLATSSTPRLTQSAYDETLASKLLISGTANGYKWISAGLVCTGRMSVDFTFECASPEDTVIRVTVAGRENTYKVSELDRDSNGRYTIRLNGIMAYEFDETITAEFIKDGETVGETLNYSVNSYIVYANELYASSENESEIKLAELVRAISCYGNSAKAYYEQIKGE